MRPLKLKTVYILAFISRSYATTSVLANVKPIQPLDRVTAKQGCGVHTTNYTDLKSYSTSHSYPFKAWCEIINRQSYFHRFDSGRCYSSATHDDGLPWTDINHDELTSLIRSKDIQLFDVRTVEEVRETGMMPGATNIPLSDMTGALNLDEDEFQDTYGVSKPKMDDTNIVFSCLGGIRSRAAMGIAHESGFVRARHYLGGWEEWEEKIKS